MKNFKQPLASVLVFAVLAIAPQVWAKGIVSRVTPQAQIIEDFDLPERAPVELKLEIEKEMTAFEEGAAPLLLAQARGNRGNRSNRSNRRSSQADIRETPVARRKVADPRLVKANQLARSGQYQEASKLLFQLSRSPEFEKEASQIKYILGLMLFEMKMNQAAAFVFFDVIRSETQSGRKSAYLKRSLQKLSIAADMLDSDVLLKYAIKQIDENEFPAESRDMLYFRTGEVRLSEKNFEEAARFFARVKPTSLFASKAKYLQALAYAEAKQLPRAQASFEELLASSPKAVTDRNRVNALMGRARVLYQAQNWDAAIEAYRDIPRDTDQWHESLFESSWAMLRGARFRSALSNFHSLHSPYYEDFYQPESLLLRAIVYLYICRYDEMAKVLDLYERIYKPVLRDLTNTLRVTNDPVAYYRELIKIQSNFESLKNDRTRRRAFQIPFLVARQIVKEGDIRRTFAYLRRLDEERARIASQPSGWSGSGIGVYAKRTIDKRIEATQILLGKQVRRHMLLVQNDLRDLFEQNGFLRFEMISGKKEAVKKELAGKGIGRRQIDDNQERDFFIQNGYDYYPFKGEYWLDEIGNYHFVGVQACE